MREYARSIKKGTNDTLILHIYPGADSEFTLIEDDRNSNDYLKGIYAKTMILLKDANGMSELSIAPALGYYNRMKEPRNWKVYIHSSIALAQLTLNGHVLSFKNEGEIYMSDLFSANKYTQNDIKISYK